jgi:hypothetical protein
MQATTPKKKTSVLKILLILFGVGVLAVGVLVAAAVWWFSNNKDRLVAQGSAARTEGTAYAKDKTNDECVAESLHRTDACGSGEFICRATAGLFLDGCLHASAPSAGICRDVPLDSEIMKTVSWRAQVCQRLGHADVQACGQTLDQLQKFCAEKNATPRATVH